MTEEPRALSIIYAPEDCPHRDYKVRCNHRNNLGGVCDYTHDCPHRDYNVRCHHRNNLDGICNYPHDFPDECPLTKVKVML